MPYDFVAVQGAGHAIYSIVLSRYVPRIHAFYYEHLALGQLSGLAARPGYGSGQPLTIDSTGVSGDVLVLMAAVTRQALSLGALGTLCLPFGTTVSLPPATLPAAPGTLPTGSITFDVPAGASGQTVYWQAIHVFGVTPRTLTNSVTTTFP